MAKSQINGDGDIKIEDIHFLLDSFSKQSYKAKDDKKSDVFIDNCLKLFGKDYKYSVIDNINGELCSHYPAKIVLLEYASTCQNNERVESLYDLPRLKELFTKARFARCRARFVVPVILINGKHICRSATLSGGAELYGRTSFDFFFTGGESVPEEVSLEASNSQPDWQLFNRIRGQDIKLLKTWSVKYIIDLMVEKKKVKFGMNVTSSEKVDKEQRYADFTIFSMPYPGCEFFHDWQQNSYYAEGMVYDWDQNFVDSILDIPLDNVTSQLPIDWKHYQKWDLVKLTQNYLRLVLDHIKESDAGLLIHCISGWDRTPLFVSLVRISLWADGLIHASLNAAELLYLTLAYDWYLFGHNLPDRMGKGEEILFFCFHFVKYITGDEFSARKVSKTGVGRNDSDINIDGVLLDYESHYSKLSNRGSNTSLNSSCSVTSNRSSVDAPLVFSASQEEDQALNGNSISGHRRSPLHFKPSHLESRDSHRYSGTDHRDHRHTSDPRELSYHRHSTDRHTPNAQHSASSSPMAVPSNAHRLNPDNKQSLGANSPGFGSWQIISGAGSYRGSMASHESPRSSGSESHSGSSASYKSRNSSYCETSEPSNEDSQRKQRLELLRKTFLNVYSVVHRTKLGQESVSSSLLDMFAEKVGIRTKSSLFTNSTMK
ncbi:unnamed protein product [Owenia fusiformis]|uniref:Myotubularin-related protein 14 n=1 Tax=Owenia fusiformis TaxID=6347 RepID=A0A8S4NQB3_OWEFU|nr:unnamed protein product [Owenia fusiformis]